MVNEFPEFRLKNMASAMSTEEHPDDRLVVEHFPLNTDYGCKVDRGSNITIVCTTSRNEVGIFDYPQTPAEQQLCGGRFI